MDARRRRAERAAATGDPQAQQHLLWLDSQEWGPWALQPIRQVEYYSATGDVSARDYLIRRYDLRPNERYTNDGLNMTCRIDLKHSIWTASPESFRERAPYTLRLIQEGVIDGQLLEHGGSLRIQSSPDKEDRHGEIRFEPGPYGIDVNILLFGPEGSGLMRDEAIQLHEPEPLPLPEVMARIDAVEELFLEDIAIYDGELEVCDECSELLEPDCWGHPRCHVCDPCPGCQS
jgi:hypothetical protein